MGTTNHGTQTIVYQYFLEATAENWGKRFLDIHPTGIYSGCRVEITGNTSLQLGQMVVEIRDATNQVCIRTSALATISDATLDSGSISSATPYLVLRWVHTASAANYLEVHAIASLSARLQYDLVIGKMTFTGGALTGFDYADRSHPRTPGVELRVEPLTGASMNLLVRGGRYPTGNTNYPVQETQIGPFVAPAAPYSRIDLVYMAGGAPAILQGTPAVSPVAPNYVGRSVLAEVRVVNGDTSLSWDRITDVRPSLWPSAVPDGSTISYDLNGKLSIVNRVQVVPKWNVTVCNANNYTLPTQFVTPIAEFSIPSFGSFCGTAHAVQNMWLFNNSIRFRMTVNSIGATVKTLKLFAVDNWVYIYIDGVEVYRYVGIIFQWDSPVASIPLNFTNGDHIVDMVFADQGGAAYLDIVGDIVDGTTVLFKA